MLGNQDLKRARRALANARTNGGGEGEGVEPIAAHFVVDFHSHDIPLEKKVVIFQTPDFKGGQTITVDSLERIPYLAIECLYVCIIYK